MKKKTSLKDIASKVGVSIATVSYVLSKGENSNISVEVAERVKKAADDLNYQPNQIAKSLKMGKTFTIGLIVADISNPFFAHIARIIEDEAANSNYTVIFGSSDEKANKLKSLIQFLINRQVDGFIIAPPEGSKEQLEQLKNQGIPFVLLDRNFPELTTNYVVIDNYKASQQAIKRLIDNGSLKIGMIAYETSLQHMRDRIDGYRSMMEEKGITIKKNWLQKVNLQNLKEEVESAIEALIKDEEKVDAIFFATNTLTVQGLIYLSKLNYKIPHDISIVSFDEGEAFDLFYCPLTYIKQPLKEIGENAVRILIDDISKNTSINGKVTLNSKLIIGDSCKSV